MTPLLAQVLEVAASQVGVRELGRNRGPMVDEYLRAAGLDPDKGSYPWCAAFVVWCFRRAAFDLGVSNPIPRTAAVHKLWARSPEWAQVQRPTTGAIFCIDHGHGLGHAGLVEEIDGTGNLVTIEGNTSRDGGREGDGVWRRYRKPTEINLGYLDFGREVPKDERVG